MTGPDVSAPQAPDPLGSGANPASTPAGRVPRRAGGIAIAAVALVLTATGLGAWLAGTESGMRALIGTAQRASGSQLEVVAPVGRLIGPFGAQSIRFSSADLRIDVEGVEFDWSPAALLSRRLDIDHLAARQLFVARGSSSQDVPLAAPRDLHLPLSVEVRRVAIERFELRGIDAPDAQVVPPSFTFSALTAAMSSDGRKHRISSLALTLPQGRAQVDLELDGQSPFALVAQGQFAGMQGGRAYNARLSAGGTLIEPHVVLDAEGEGLQGHAELLAAPFDALPLRALKLALGEVDPSVFVSGAPQAALRLEADLTSPAGSEVLLRGPIRIDNRNPAALDAGGLPLRSVAGDLAWRAGELGVTGLDVRTSGAQKGRGEGRVTGQLSWVLPPSQTADSRPQDGRGKAPATPDVGPAALGRVVAELELAGIDTRALDSRLPSQTLAGQIGLDADASRQQARIALILGKARFDATAAVSAVAPDEGGTASRAFTLDGSLRGVDPRALSASAPSALLNLDVEASGTLGTRNEFQARFALPGSRFGGKPLGGEGAFRYAGDAKSVRLSDVALALDLADNRLRARGAWGGPGDRLALRLDAPTLAAIGYGVGGRAGAEGTLGGDFASPSGALTFYGEALRLPGGLRLAGVNGEARLDAGMTGPFRLSVGLSGLAADGAEAAASMLAESAFVAAEGTRAAHTLRLEASGLQGHTLSLRLQGGLRPTPATNGAPDSTLGRLGWAGQLTELESAGRFAMRLLGPAAIELGPERVSLAATELAMGEQGRIRLQETRWTPTASVARGSLTGLVVDLRSRDATRPVATRGDRPRRGAGPLTLGAEWNLRAGDTLDGEARVFRESGDLGIEGEIRTRLGLEALEARLSARGDRLGLSLEARGSEMGRVEGSASVRAERSVQFGWRIAPQAALLGSARFDMPSVTWLGRLMRENVETGGSLGGEFALAGTVAEPLASGRINGRALQFALVDQGLLLSGGELDMSFDRDRLRLDRLSFVSPNRVRPRDNRVPFERLTSTPGTLDATGEILLATGAGEFRFEAKRLPLLQRADRWLIVSGEGWGRSTWTTLDLKADFRADAGYLEFAETPPPTLGEDVVVLGREEVPGSFGVSADLRVALGDALYLSAMGLDTRLAGELRLRQQPGLPLSAVGTVATVGGSYRGYGQHLSVERGVVNFQGALDNPGLNVVALRKGLAVEAGVEILGSARRPVVRLVSEPAVPDPEKLSWIVLGRAPDAASGADLGLLLPAAQALLGGPGGGMTDQLSRSLGFDSLSIGQGELNSTARRATSRVVGGGSVIAGGPTVSGQVLSLGKRLGTDLFLSFEQGLGGAETLVKLTYQLSRRLSLIARGGTDNALDLHYSFSFR